MKERILRYTGGYLKVRLTGPASERFLNLCMARGITLWDLSRPEGEALCFFVSIRDFRRIGPLVKKAGVHVKITGRFGLPFFLYRNRTVSYTHLIVSQSWLHKRRGPWQRLHFPEQSMIWPRVSGSKKPWEFPLFPSRRQPGRPAASLPVLWQPVSA